MHNCLDSCSDSSRWRYTNMDLAHVHSPALGTDQFLAPTNFPKHYSKNTAVQRTVTVMTKDLRLLIKKFRLFDQWLSTFRRLSTFRLVIFLSPYIYKRTDVTYRWRNLVHVTSMWPWCWLRAGESGGKNRTSLFSNYRYGAEMLWQLSISRGDTGTSYWIVKGKYPIDPDVSWGLALTALLSDHNEPGFVLS